MQRDVARCIVNPEGEPCVETFAETDAEVLRKWSPHAKATTDLPDGYRIRVIRFEDITNDN